MGIFKDDKFAAGGDSLTLADICLLATYTTLKATGMMDLSEYKNAEAWEAKMIKLIPNYEKVNGEGCEGFGAFYKSKRLNRLSAESHFMLRCVPKNSIM